MRIFILSLGLYLCLCGAAQAAGDYTAVAQNYITEQSRITGSLDMYDGKIKKVRHLQLLKWESFKPQDEDPDKVLGHGDFRDTANGDVLDVSFLINTSGDTPAVEDTRIVGLKSASPQQDAASLEKVFTQDEVRAAIRKYITQKSKFTQTFAIFDPDLQKFFKLKWKGFTGDMRHFGVLYIQTTDFTDEGGKPLSYDVTVKNEHGALAVQSFKRL